MAKILNGKIVADRIIADLEPMIKDLKAKNIKPTLAVISVGDNSISKIFLQQKQKRIEGLGLGFNLYEFLAIATSEQIIELIQKLNSAVHIDGILVQLPLPSSLSKKEILDKINKKKDVDALAQSSSYKSPTAQAILEILNFYQILIKGQKVVVIGKGDLVGKPFVKMAKKQGAQVVLLDIKTKNLADKILTADIVVSAAGQANLINTEMVSKKCVIIDAGTSVENGSQVGDVDFAKVVKKVKAITPPTGGVGPVTIACLIRNLIKAVKHRKDI